MPFIQGPNRGTEFLFRDTSVYAVLRKKCGFWSNIENRPRTCAGSCRPNLLMKGYPRWRGRFQLLTEGNTEAEPGWLSLGRNQHAFGLASQERVRRDHT